MLCFCCRQSAGRKRIAFGENNFSCWEIKYIEELRCIVLQIYNIFCQFFLFYRVFSTSKIYNSRLLKIKHLTFIQWMKFVYYRQHQSYLTKKNFFACRRTYENFIERYKSNEHCVSMSLMVNFVKYFIVNSVDDAWQNAAWDESTRRQ